MSRPTPETNQTALCNAHASSSHEPHADCRCACGSLLARWVEGGVELKCRRCKRTVLVPLATDDGALGAPALGARAQGAVSSKPDFPLGEVG